MRAAFFFEASIQVNNLQEKYMFQQTQSSPVVASHAQPVIEEKQGLSALGRELMTAANWDIDKARKQLVARARDDEELLVEALRIAADQVLSTISSGRRHQIFTKAVPPGKDDTRALQRMASQSVLDTYLVGGVRLGDCSPNALREAIHARKSAAQTHERNAAFLAAVLKRLKPATKRVRDELNEDDARRLARKFPC
jgi:hypothetical protein